MAERAGKNSPFELPPLTCPLFTCQIKTANRTAPLLPDGCLTLGAFASQVRLRFEDRTRSIRGLSLPSGEKQLLFSHAAVSSQQPVKTGRNSKSTLCLDATCALLHQAEKVGSKSNLALDHLPCSMHVHLTWAPLVDSCNNSLAKSVLAQLCHFWPCNFCSSRSTAAEPRDKRIGPHGQVGNYLVLSANFKLARIGLERQESNR